MENKRSFAKLVELGVYWDDDGVPMWKRRGFTSAEAAARSHRATERAKQEKKNWSTFSGWKHIF